MAIFISICLVLFSTWMIAKVCDGFEAAADHLGRNMSEGVKGATINAIGSSMPELCATMVFLFLFNDTGGFAGGIATTAGSAVFNTMIIPAVSILTAIKIFKLSAVNVSKKVILRDGIALITIELILIVTIGEHLTWWHGLMLMSLYIIYIAYMLTNMKKSHHAEYSIAEAEEEEQDKVSSENALMSWLTLDLENAVIGERKTTNQNAWALLIVSTFFIALSCYLLVLGCELLGHELGLKSYFVAVIIAAAASSVPDTILSVRDAKKGNYDDAVSNALGSNIFDICFALGLPLFLYTIINGPIFMPIDMVDNVGELRVLLLLLTIAAFILFYFGKALGKAKAYTLIGLYIFFAAYIISKAYDLAWVQPITALLKHMLHTMQLPFA
ncbi:hypothetical protein [Vibrio sp. S11_S32]|uniref:hypothetical protein n=1 Tax=Vibrio sp. S11_S32 TaxID=2720225 RepID=UPI001933CBB8